MNALTEKNYIKEMECGGNYACILNDSSTFLSTEYKVLQSQSESHFVRCMRMLYNGKVQLYYLTAGLKPFASMIPSLDPDSLMTVVTNLFSDIIDVKHNGFLSCRNIDSSFERIYIDPATLKVKLIYLPLSVHLYEDGFSLETEIRTAFIKLISGVSTLCSPRTLQLSADLSNGTLSLEELLARMKSGQGGGSSRQQQEKEKPLGMRMVAMNSPIRMELVISKDDFIIGRKPELCDGVVGFSNLIGRSHCRITRDGNAFSVTDLRSANGTYLNGVKLQPNEPYRLKNGDVVRLASSNFRVMIG